MRIVSLACSNTEMACSNAEIIATLGCSHLLVGADDNPNHPRDVVNGLAALRRVVEKSFTHPSPPSFT